MIDFLDVACKLLLRPTRQTESPRRKAGSTQKTKVFYTNENGPLCGKAMLTGK